MLQIFQDVIHYLDNFLTILSSPKVASEFDRVFSEICEELRIIINHKKDLINTILDFLGIELDIILMQARLLQEKLQQAVNTVI